MYNIVLSSTLNVHIHNKLVKKLVKENYILSNRYCACLNTNGGWEIKKILYLLNEIETYIFLCVKDWNIYFKLISTTFYIQKTSITVPNVVTKISIYKLRSYTRTVCRILRIWDILLHGELDRSPKVGKL